MKILKLVMRWDAVCIFHVFPIFQNGSSCNNALLHVGGQVVK